MTACKIFVQKTWILTFRYSLWTHIIEIIDCRSHTLCCTHKICWEALDLSYPVDVSSENSEVSINAEDSSDY